MKSLHLIPLIIILNYIYSAPDPNFYIFLCFGQSNMAGQGEIEEQDKINVPERFKVMASIRSGGREQGKWYTAVPPLGGPGLSPVDYFGRHLVENLPEKIKIGVIVVAIGGTSIIIFDEDKCAEYIETFTAEWLIESARAYNNNPFRVLMDRAKEAQQDGVIKGILMHQGESDNGDTTWPNKVKLVYDRMIKELNLDEKEVPLLAGEVVGEENHGSFWKHNAIIATLPDVIPNAHVISSAGLEPNGADTAHFSSNSYRIFGRRYAEKYLELLPKDDGPKEDGNNNESKSNKSNIGVIIGVTIACLLLVGIGTFIYFKFFRKREQINYDDSKMKQMNALLNN